MPTPACVHVYGGPKIYINYRNSDGSWTTSALYGETSWKGTSTGTLTDANPNKRGVISRDDTGLYGTVYWLGDGPPDDKLGISISNSILGDAAPILPVYWEASCGGWWINNAWYIILSIKGGSGYRRTILKSVGYEGGDIDRPNLWTEMDQANAPKSSNNLTNSIWLRWDGISTIVDMLLGSGSSYALYSYNFSTDTWTGPYGSFTPGFQMYSSLNGLALIGNGIYRFPNNDIGIVYGRYGVGTYYRLYEAASSTWGSPVLIKSGSVLPGTVIPDPAQESLHIFVVDFSVTEIGSYHIVSHAGSVQTDLFTWPDVASPDNFGNGVIWDNKLFVPYDDYSDNIIWVAPLTGGVTTFTAERLDRPAGETQDPSCASMFYIPPGGSSLYVFLTDVLALSDSLDQFASQPDLSDLLSFLDAVSIRLSGGDLSIKPFIDGCPEIIVASEYCTSWKPWKTNTLQEVSGCDDEAYSSVPPTQCD